MALLSAPRRGCRALLLLALGGVGSCASSASLGHVDLWLKSCNGRADDCDDASASAAGEEYMSAQAFLDASASRYAPHGIYTYFELPRADGSVGILELDLPTNAPSDKPLTRFQASYRELAGEQVLFASRKVEGRLELPPGFGSDQEPLCSCGDGAFALRFVDAGKDRVAGTDDDRVRHLSWGRIGRSEKFCRGLAPMPIGRELQLSIVGCATPDTASFQPSVRQGPEPMSTWTPEPAAQPVLVTAPPPTCNYACYGNPAPSQPTSSGGCGSDSSGGGCGDDSSGSSSGCGSDDSSSSSSSSGCGSHDDSQSSSSGSCNGNSDSSQSSSSSSSSSSGSCEGDTTDDHSSSCTIARPKPKHGRRGHWRDPFMGTGLPLVLVCLVQLQRARRLRQVRGVYRSARAV